MKKNILLENNNKLNWVRTFKKSEVLKMQGVQRSTSPMYFKPFIPIVVYSRRAKSNYVIRYILKKELLEYMSENEK